MAELDLAKARMLLLEKAPYFASIVYGLVFIETDSVPTAAVSKDMRMFYNKEWMSKLNLDEQAFIIGHESSHIFMDHCDRQTAGNFLPFYIWNVAADCESNDDLVSMGFSLTDNFRDNICLPHNMNFPSHHAAEYYFDALMKNATKVMMPMGGEGGCGTGAGGQESQAEKNGEGKEDGRKAGDVERIRREVAQEIQEHVKRKGSVPAGMKRKADDILKKPQVNWSNLLMGTIRSIVNTRRGLADFTYSKINSRKSGNIIFPAMVAPVLKIGFLIDTSGSMSDHELGMAIAHCKVVMDQTAGSEYWLAIVDAALHSCRKINSTRDIHADLRGGGGSNLIPAFEALEKEDVAVIIAITDLYADIPDKCKPDVVWVVSQNDNPSVPYGKIIKMGEKRS